MKKLVLVGALLIVTLVFAIKMHSAFQIAYPSKAEVIKSVSIFTNAKLSEDIEIVWARGDLFNFSSRTWRECSLVLLPAEELDEFLNSLRTDGAYSFAQDSFSCPAQKKADELRKNHQLKFYGTGAFTHHAGYAVYLNLDKNLVFLQLQIF